MSEYPLLEYVQATADSSGRAVVSTGPQRYGETWHVELMATTTNSVAESQLRVYRGVEADTALVASTYSGNQDTAGGNTTVVPSGDKLVFVWSGATAGAQCTCRIEGTLKSRRR